MTNYQGSLLQSERQQQFMKQLTSGSSQTEIYLQGLPMTDNVVYRAEQDYSGPRDTKQWSQVFDLKDSILICNVEGNELDMRLVHLTDQPLNDYISMVQKGRIKMPGGTAVTRPFLKTEEDEREQLREYFEQYSSAKIIVNGTIMQQLNLAHSSTLASQNMTPNYTRGYQTSTNTNFGYETLTPSGQNQAQYCLKFATSSNLIYQFNFERFYLKKEEGIFGVSVKDISEKLQGGSVKAFDIVKDYELGQEILAVGIGLPIGSRSSQYQPQETNAIVNNPHNEETLYLLKGDPSSEGGLNYQILGKQNIVEGIFSNLKQKVKQTIKNSAAQQFLSGKKITNLGEQRVSSRAATEEGVVTVQALTNALVGVIYSSGLFRIWSIYSGALISEQNLFELLELDALSTKEQKQKYSERIVSAKIAYLSKDYVLTEDSLQKQIAIVVAYQIQSYRTFNTQWNLSQFRLNFSNLPVKIDEANKDMIDLGQDAELHQILSQKFGFNVEVTNVLLESDAESKNSHLWVTTFSEKDKESRIIDMYEQSSQSVVWDKTNQSKYYQFTDQIELSKDLQDKPFSPYQDALRRHFYKRIVMRNRFQKTALETYVNELICDIQDDRKATRWNMTKKIRTIIGASDVSQLGLLIKNVSSIENQNSRISGMSVKLSGMPLRVVIRNLGISVLKDDIALSSIQNSAKKICIHLDSHRNNLDQSTIISIFDSSPNSEPLIKLLGGIKYMLGPTLPLLDAQLVSPSNSSPDLEPTANIRQILKTVLRQAYRQEALHLQMLTIIERNHQQIDMQLNMLTQHLLNQLFDDFRGGQGSKITDRLVYPTLGAEYNSQMMKLIERSLLVDIENVYECVRDLALLRVYIETCMPLLVPPPQQVRFEQQTHQMLLAWLTQLAALNKILNKNYQVEDPNSQNGVTSRSINNSNQISTRQTRLDASLAAYETMGRGSLLQHLLSKDSELSMSAIASSSGTIVQFDQLIGSLIKAYTYKYPPQSQTYIPHLVRKLDSLQQWKSLQLYLNCVGQDVSSSCATIGMDFARAYIGAKTGGEPPSEFVKYMGRALSKFQTIQLIPEEMARIKYTQLILGGNSANEDQIYKKVNAVTNKQNLQFYLTILEQLADLDGRYSIYVIKSALQMVPFLQEKESDFLYQSLFRVSRADISLDYMYLACNKVGNRQTKKSLIGQFFERLCSTGAGNAENTQQYLATKCFFSQDDTDLAMDYLFSKIDQAVRGSDEKAQKVTAGIYSIKWRKDTEQLIKLINLIAKLYSRSQETCRFLWHVKQQLDQAITKQIVNFDQLIDKKGEQASKSQVAVTKNGGPVYTNTQEILKLQQFALEIILNNALSVGDSFMMTDDSDVQAPNKKRKIQSISSSETGAIQKMQIDEDQSKINNSNKNPTLSKFQIIEQLKECEKDSQFLHGEIRQVTVEELVKCCLYVKARLICLKHTRTTDVALLVKVLTEFNEFDLACELALAYKEAIAYPLAQLIKNYSQQDPFSGQQNNEDIGSVDQQPLSLYQRQARAAHNRPKLSSLTQTYQQQEQLTGLSSKSNTTSPEFIYSQSNRHDLIQSVLEEYLDKLRNRDVIELVQRLVMEEVQLPLELEKEIIKRGHIAGIIEAYLSAEGVVVHYAVDTIQRYMPDSVHLLASTNINLLVLLLTNIDSAYETSGDLINSFKSQEANLLRILANNASKNNNNVAGVNRSFLPPGTNRGGQSKSMRDLDVQFSMFSQDLNEFYGDVGQDQAAANNQASQDPAQAAALQKTNNETKLQLGQVRTQLNDEIFIKQTLKHGSIAIKEALRQYLSN